MFPTEHRIHLIAASFHFQFIYLPGGCPSIVSIAFLHLMPGAFGAFLAGCIGMSVKAYEKAKKEEYEGVDETDEQP